MQRFLGKHCLITAATKGIGYATAKRVAQEGGTVVICSRREDNLNAALAALKGEGLQADGLVANVETDQQTIVNFAVQKHGKIDCVMSNLGLSRHVGPTLETPEPMITRMFHANVIASHLLIQAAVPYLNPEASIVLLSSITAYNVNPNIGFYCVSKAAMVSLTRVLALELAPKKIRVNAIAAGLTQTKFSEKFLDQTQRIPMKRAATPEEIAGPATFLMSDDARYITGETIVVAGGEY